MKKSILRPVVSALVLAVLLGLLVACICWFLGLRTAIQFSNAFFLTGAVCIVIGLFSIMGGFKMRSDFRLLYSQSAGDMNIGDRAKLWFSDLTQGYGSFILSFITGALLIGFSVLIGKLF